MKQAGWLMGGVFLLSVGLAAHYSMRLLIRTANLTNRFTYADLADVAYGRSFAVAVQAIILFGSFLSLVGYAVLLCDFFNPLLVLIFGEGSFIDDRTVIIIFVSLAFLLPLCLLRDLDPLRFTSAVAVVAVLFSVLVVFVRFIGGTECKAGSGCEKKLFNASPDLFLAVPLLSAAFAGHINLLPIYREMQNRFKPSVNQVIHAAIGGSAVLYFAMGFFGYMTFGSLLPDDGNVLNAYGDDVVLVVIARAAFAFVITFSYPLLLFACRRNLNSLVLNQFSKDSSLRWFVETFLIIALTSFVSRLVPGISTVLSLNGAITMTVTVFLAPALFSIRIEPGPLSSKVPQVVLAVVGVVLGFIGLAMSIKKMIT